MPQKQSELFELEPSFQKEARFYFVLIGKRAVKVSGNWQSLVERELRQWHDLGMRKLAAGNYTQVIATRNEILWRGFTLLEDTTKAVNTFHHTITPSNFKQGRTKSTITEKPHKNESEAVWL